MQKIGLVYPRCTERFPFRETQVNSVVHVAFFFLEMGSVVVLLVGAICSANMVMVGRRRTKRCSRIAIASCDVDNPLAAIC